MRINKFIAHAGLASRRKADELIKAGKVKVNGEVIIELGLEIKEQDRVEVNGVLVGLEEEKVYYMLNKPTGYLSTASDDRGRKTVIDILKPKVKERIYPVGRLDLETEGLIILTNDGEIANKLIHPSSNIEKTYYVELDRPITVQNIRAIERGVDIGGYTTKKSQIKKIGTGTSTHRCLITIEEGKNRQVRKMFETQRLRVKYLKRLRIGELYLEDLNPGEFRKLTKKELQYLRKLN